MRCLLGRTALALSLASTFALGCAGTPKPPVRAARPKIVKREEPKPKPAPISGPMLLPSHVLAKLDDDSASPYVARRGDDILVFYDARGRLRTRLCASDGAPKTVEPLDVGPAAAEMPIGSLEAVGDGYVAAWVEGLKANAAVKVLALDATGAARGAPLTLAQSADEVNWVEILPVGAGALVVWQVPRDNRADVLATAYTPGHTPSSAVVLAHDVYGWDAVATADGASLAMVVAATGEAVKAAEQNQTGRVLYAEVDAAGRVSPPVTVNAEPTAQNDVVIAKAGGRALIAWTDMREIDSSVYVAAVERGGKIARAPKRATTPIGEQALVSLVSGAAGRALLAWEDLLRVPREGTLIHLATLDEEASLGKERATIVFASSGRPFLTPDGDGFAARTLAPASTGSEPAPAEAPILQTFVRFGPDLAVRAAEPIRAEPFAATDGAPYLTHSLSCHHGSCVTLASSEGTPATLALVDLPVRQSPWRAPAWRDADDTPPRPLALSALYDGEHLARVAGAELKDGSKLAAWVTYFLEGSEAPAKKDGPLATVSVRSVSAANVPGKTLVLSKRAVSIGGVALAPALAGKTDEAVVAWAAREKTESQIQVVKLAPGVDKPAPKALTTIARKPSKDGVPSEVSDVAVAYKPASDPGKTSDDGWIVAWVDTRDGNAEIYAASIDRTLRKVVTDRRITEAPGDSAEVQIAVKGKETFLVWSDARQNPDEGNGDIHAVRLDTRTLQKVGPEVRLFASPGHSRSPSVSFTADKLVVAWIEEPNPEVKGEDDTAGVRIAVLDERGNVLGLPRLVRGEEQSPVTSVALSCGPEKCRGVLTSALRESMILDAFELSPGAPPSSLKSLAALTGGVSADISLSLPGVAASSLFFGDDATSGSGRVRYMTIAWP